MNLLLLVPGIALVVFTFVDALWTTLWIAGGGGPISLAVMRGVRAVSRPVSGRGRHRAASLAGPGAILGTLVTWVLLLWAGWTLVFLSGPESLRVAATGETPDVAGYAYFVGYTIFTLGLGDVVPRGGVWQIATAVATGSGLFLVTLAVTYIINVVNAVVEKRALAGTVLDLARSPGHFLMAAWEDGRFGGLGGALESIAGDLRHATERHLAYPILHDYHAERVGKAPAVAVAVLDEALTILTLGVREDARTKSVGVRLARAAADDYLSTLKSAFITPADEVPPPPDLASLRDAGVPVVSDEEFAAALVGLTERRCLLLGLVQADGWTWDDVRH